MAETMAKVPAADAALIDYLKTSIDDVAARLASEGLPDTVRRAETERLEALRRQLLQAEVGGSLKEWIALLSQSDLIAELLDAENAGGEKSEEWERHTKRTWDANRRSVESRLQLALGRELARPTRGQTSLETLGLVEMAYPGLDALSVPNALLGELPTTQVRDGLCGAWPEYLSLLCDSLRADGAITLGSEEDDAEYGERGPRIGRWCCEIGQGVRWLVSFVGTNPDQRRRLMTKGMLSTLGIPDASLEVTTSTVLGHAFRQLREQSAALSWIEAAEQDAGGRPVPALRLVFRELGLRAPAQLFRCATTDYVWAHSALGFAPQRGCDALTPVSAGELDEDPRIGRLRREISDSPVFRIALWAEEHSAQLSPAENRRLQDLFKLGARNVLELDHHTRARHRHRRPERRAHEQRATQQGELLAAGRSRWAPRGRCFSGHRICPSTPV